MKKITLPLLITVTAIAGCKSTPKYQEGVAFNENNSYALNIASQSELAGDSNSPLRDFSAEEVDEVKANIHKNYGSASKVLGALSILTGNFTGLLDIAGGYAADFGKSYHPAINSRWLIALDKSEFNNKEEALEYAQSEIVAASIGTLEKHGTVIRKVNEKNGSQYFELEVEGQRSPIGFGSSQKGKVVVEEGKFFKDNSSTPQSAYLIGFTGEVYSKFGNTPMITVANNSIEQLDIKESDFYKELTRKLPEGFYLYMPSFPKYRGNGKIYTDLDAVVPSIYYQGEKHDFIKL